jgi:hemolysin D
MSMHTLILAWHEMGRRYLEVFRTAWGGRNALESVERTSGELAFLPAHLELIERPLSPAPRWTARLIMALFAIGLAWACIGQLDIVAVAPGKVVGGDRTKVIQPMETAIVRRILVEDGQAVHRGDLLIELDAVGVGSDAAKATDAVVSARLTQVRTRALVAAVDRGSVPLLPSDPLIPNARLREGQTLATSEFSTFIGKRRSLDAVVQQKEAELSTVDASIAPAVEYARIAKDRVEDYRKLLDKKYVSRQDYLIREQERISAEREVDSLRHRRTELSAGIAAARQDRNAAVADARRQWLDQEREAGEVIQQAGPDADRASQRHALMQLQAPVDGVVQQLAIHTVGGVVTPAQPLLAIVPDDQSVEVEATVFSQDIGFIHTGQAVTVKLDTFPYTRYGYVTGTVTSVSHDAVQDEKRGLLFPVRIALSSSSMEIDGTRVALSPGMSLSAEVRTGRRRVIDYVLSPLQKAGSDAFHER